MCRTAKSTFPLAFTPARTQDKAKKLASDWSILTTNQMLRLGISSWITDYIDIHIPRYADVYVYTCLRYVYMYTCVYT